MSAGSGNLVELNAGGDGDRRSNLQRALHGLGMGRIISRRRSDPVGATGGTGNRPPEWTTGDETAGGSGGGGLQHIPEMG